MRVAHIAWYKRTPPDSHSGGVPLFGHYMARRLGARLYSWSDMPNRPACTEPQAAEMLGQWLVASGELKDVDAVIVDGFWGRGLAEFPRPVISVAHGTWRGIGLACRSPRAMELGDLQEAEYRRLPTVAVSNHAAVQLRTLYGVEPAAIIRNGVDLDEFHPVAQDHPRQPVVIYASDAYPKGGDLVEALCTRRPEIEFRTIGAPISGEAQAIAAGDVFVSPSRTDGCAYAGLQALACGLPVVASRVGLFADMDEYGVLDGCQVGESLLPPPAGTEPAIIERWSAALSRVLAQQRAMAVAARTWAERYASLELWEGQWRNFLEEITGGDASC